MVSTHHGVLRVPFGVRHFISNENLFDPKNLETTYDYYLFENLSATLIRDSTTLSTNKYSGVLAESWEQTKTTLSFKLKENLKWSDGTAIECVDLKNHFKILQSGHSRHLQFLKNLESISCNQDTHTLIFNFEHPISSATLHEFSLADTALVKNGADGKPRWDITSGHYYVKVIDRNKPIIILEKNEFFKDFPNKAPTTVLMKDLGNESKYSILLDEAMQWDRGYDFFAPQGGSFLPIMEELINHSQNKLMSQPMHIHYLSFIKGNNEFRSRLQSAIQESKTINHHHFWSKANPKINVWFCAN